MAPPVQRTGPARAVVARDYIGPLTKAVTTCFPCEFLTHRGGQSYCRHEPMNGAHIGRTGGTYETPPTCPLLPAARLALARRIVAEADGTTVAALAADECPGKGRCHGAMKWCETCGTVAGTCDDTACDQHDAAHGAGQSEEQR